MKVILGFFLGALLLALGVAGYVVFEANHFLKTAPEQVGRTVYFDVLPGARLKTVAQDLAKQGLITQASYFELLARWQNEQNALKAGRFALNTKMLPKQVLWTLVHGRPVLYRITIPEGLTIWQTAELLDQQGFVEKQAFLKVTSDPAFLRHYGLPLSSAEGFLMPDTYLLKKPEETSAQVYEKKEEAEVKTEGQSEGNTEAKTKGNTEAKTKEQAKDQTKDQAKDRTKDQTKDRTKDQTAEKVKVVVEEKIESQEDPENRQAWLIAGRLVDNFWQKSKALWPNQKKPERQALVRLVVLASIVEKETAKASERARIAGVYNNRLEKQMLLQADPTVIYGLGPSFQGRLLKRHLEDVKNPYNTYQHPGLPPGPICSFGLGALAAALKPEQHSFLYFVASEDGGAHVFSKRLEEHNVAVQKYRKRTREKKAEQERAR